MARFIRGALVALIAVLVGLGGALPSNAAVEPSPSVSPSAQVYGCLQPLDSYGVHQVCELRVHILTPVCDKDVPKLRYKIDAVGTPNTKVTITWLNPSGPNVVYADLPLEGTVNWPGAVEGPDGRGIDWPGWKQLPDGSWVEGDEFDWVRPNVNVLFQVNPEATMTVAYPPSSPSCLTDPPDETEVLADNPQTAVLSATGSDAGPLVIAGAGLVVVGALVVAMVAIARRRRTSY